MTLGERPRATNANAHWQPTSINTGATTRQGQSAASQLIITNNINNMPRETSVFVTNADIATGETICQHLLLGKHRGNFENVYCGVQNVGLSGSLWALGGRMSEVSMEPDVTKLAQHLRECDTVVLVPNCTDRRMVRQAELILGAAQQAKCRNLLVISHLGADEDTETSREFKRIEEKAKGMQFEACAIVRHGFLQQKMMWLMDFIKQGKLPLPVAPESDQAKWAPLNLDDLAQFVAYVCAQEEEGGNAVRLRRLNQQVFRLTGPELITGKSLAEKFTHNLGGEHRVEFQQIEWKQLEEHLRKNLNLPDMIVKETCDQFQLINNGRLAVVSGDEKKTIGSEPIPVDRFIQEYNHRFLPVEKRRRQQQQTGLQRHL